MGEKGARRVHWCSGVGRGGWMGRVGDLKGCGLEECEVGERVGEGSEVSAGYANAQRQVGDLASGLAVGLAIGRKYERLGGRTVWPVVWRADVRVGYGQAELKQAFWR